MLIPSTHKCSMWTYNLQNVSREQDLTRYLALPFLPCEKVVLDLRERYLFLKENCISIHLNVFSQATQNLGLNACSALFSVESPKFPSKGF